MLRIRWLGVAAMAAGFLLGLAFPLPTVSRANVGDTITVYVQPPTLSWGSSPLLTCGWHTACVSPYGSGPALDWDDNNSNFGNPWYYRSYNFTSNTGGLMLVARGIPLVSQTGGTTCEVMTVWIAEKTSGPLRAIPTYTHTNITNSSVFYIYARSYPQAVYTNRQIGTTVNDSRSNCSITGSHVHESDAMPYGNTSYARNSSYPTASTCHGSCGTFQNSNINNYTRWFQWTEGQ